MTIKINGNNTVSKIVIDEQEIGKVYVGNNLVYQAPTHNFATATYEQLADDLARHKAGIINLYDTSMHPGWAIGTTREIHLGAIPNKNVTNLTGTTWWFNGRQKETATEEVPIPVIDTGSMPNMSSGYYMVTLDEPEDWSTSYTNYYTRSGNTCNYVYTKVSGTSAPDWEGDTYFKYVAASGRWNIDFDYYIYRRKQVNNKWKANATKWVGGFTGIGRVSSNDPNAMFYMTGTTSSYTTTKVCVNSISGSTVKTTWIRPTVSSPWQSVLYRDSSKQTVYSEYQEIKITGGADVENPDLINWLLDNAYCASIATDAQYTYEVDETHPGQTVHIAITDKAATRNSDGTFRANRGFTLASGSSDFEDEEIPNQMPAFVISQVETLNTKGKLLSKETVKSKKYTGKFPTKTLKQGNSGAQVKRLQRFLNWAISAGLSVDGKFGSKTLAAVKKFQKKVSLTQDGVVGANTRAKMKTYTISTTSVESSNSGSWNGTIRRDWCNNGYYEALPSGLKNLIQDFNWYVGYGGGQSGATQYTDKVALPLERHIFGSRNYSTNEEFNGHNSQQWEYYSNQASRAGKKNGNNQYVTYWLASPDMNNTTNFCSVGSNQNGGTSMSSKSETELSFAPFMII